MARTLIITYDLSDPGQNYEDVLTKIKSHTSWARLGGSSYLILTDDKVTTVRNTLWALMDENDSLYVGVAPPPAAWAGLPQEVANWILKNQTN